MPLPKLSLSTTLLALCGLTASSAFGSVIYTVQVDTSSLLAGSGYIDLEFNPGIASQPANAAVQSFTTDGTLNPADPLNGTAGDVSGSLLGTVSFDNGTSFNDYTEAITFGTVINFNLILSGPAIDSHNGTGGGTFTLDFLNSDQSGFLFTNDSQNDVPVLTVNVNPNGTTTAQTYPSMNSGPPVVTLGGPGTVPEPATIPLVGIGIIALAAFRLRRQAA